MNARARTFVLMVAAGACSGPPEPPRYPGELVPTSELGGPDFSARHLIDGHAGDTRWRFEAVLEKRSDVLLLLGLTPFGSRAFAIEQRGTRVSYRSFVGEEALEGLPFPPRFVLLDIHRTLFVRVSAGPLSDGEHQRVRGAERIVERWRDGRLAERVFERTDGEPAGVIRVTFDPPVSPPDLPAHTTLENQWLGYDLEITRLDLEAPSR